MSSSLPSFHVLVLVLLALCTTAGVRGCKVLPPAAAVVAGDDLSLTCTSTDNSELIDSWDLMYNTNSDSVLYQAPRNNTDGSIKSERKVADGYLVNDSNPRQVILTVINASTIKADVYRCLCLGVQCFGSVSVLESEPTFSNVTEITDVKPFTFTCRVSFNGLANILITIEDSSGNMLNKTIYNRTTMGLRSFSLDYTAGASINKEYSCNIALTGDNASEIIYSKKLKVSMEWFPVRSVQIHPVDSKRCINGKQCAVNQRLLCTAEGNPTPTAFQWNVSFGGVQLKDLVSNQFTLSYKGNYTIQCIAFNKIGETLYNNTSDYFKTEGSEPTFSNVTKITDVKPFTFTCRVSFNGLANILITIEDSSGNMLNKTNYNGTTMGLRSFSLDYTANASINQEYSCNIALTGDNASETIYSKKLKVSMEWFHVRSVQIHPVDSKRCINGKQCSVNQRLRCTAEGNPTPGAFQWNVSLSGRQLKDVMSNQLSLSYKGNYTIQCMAFNKLGETYYNNVSDYFKTEVAQGSSESSEGGNQNISENTETDNNALIIGLVVGLVGSMIATAIIALTVVYCRRKRREKRQHTESEAET